MNTPENTPAAASAPEPTAATPAASPSPALPRIRYTRGPASLQLGDLPLKRGEWSGQVEPAVAEEATRPGRVQEYGFEADGYTRPPEPTAAAAGKARTVQTTKRKE